MTPSPDTSTQQQQRLSRAIALSQMSDDCLGRTEQRTKRRQQRLRISRFNASRRLKYEAKRREAGNPAPTRGPVILGNPIPIEHQNAAARRRAGLTPERRTQILRAKRKKAA